MDADPSKPLAAFGFLTILESPEHGLFGGYLVLSPQGRPLEFRCSTPVSPSRAQEILYGPTLRPYLLAEVIGHALVASSKLPVQVILTDERDILSLALLRPEPVVCVEEPLANDSPGRPKTNRLALLKDDLWLELRGCRIVLQPPDHTRDPTAAIRSLLEPLAANIDLREPFGRIRAALAEAQVAPTQVKEPADEHAAAA